jgi:secreted trypsin-like serine protease
LCEIETLTQLFSINKGGVEAGIGEFPHQALLGYNEGSPSEWGCGGSLISNKFILTAAHCLYPRGYGAVKFAKLGLNNRLQNDTQVLLFNVAEIYQHPDYNRKTLSNDIGILRLDRDVPLSERILPICLPSKFHNAERAQASGFGRTGFQQAASENLLKVTLESFTRDECQQKFSNQITVTNDTMMCYGHHTDNKDSCSMCEQFLGFFFFN